MMRYWPPAANEGVEKHTQLAPDDKRDPAEVERGEERIGCDDAHKTATPEPVFVEQHHGWSRDRVWDGRLSVTSYLEPYLEFELVPHDTALFTHTWPPLMNEAFISPR
jgi:hypothetical protein